MTLSLHGVAVSRGVCIGRIHVIKRDRLTIEEREINGDQVDAEIARFDTAIEVARRQLTEIRTRIEQTTTSNVAAFIDAHTLMLGDSFLAEETKQIIRSQRRNAEWALQTQCDAILAVFDEMEDPYLKTRSNDISFVIDRIQRALLKQRPVEHEIVHRELVGSIIVADDLTPADTILLDHSKVAGFATEYGGPTSHTAIIARSLNLPSVVGLHELTRIASMQDELIIDGNAGLVILNPDPDVKAYYLEKKAQIERYRTVLRDLTDLPAVTEDGISVSLNANVELPTDFDAAAEYKADGVGLYRTEFLYMNRGDALPSEEEHYAAYAALIAKQQGRSVTIRTVDIGADKPIEHFGSDYPANPALGLRAIRLCLTESDLFQPQLRAIIRASALGRVKMMIPMLSNVEELLRVKSMVDSIREEFSALSIAYDPNMPIGGMIEVPAAALCADAFARHLDFLSIGTNDLIQYTIAIDRIDDQVSYLYDPLNLGVLRLIKATIDAGAIAQTPVAMCGEMAGDPKYVKLLLGMGLREFSVHPNVLLEVKKLIRETRIEQIRQRINAAINATDTNEVRRIVDELNA